MEREEIQKRLKKELDKNRYEHSLGSCIRQEALPWHMDMIMRRR